MNNNSQVIVNEDIEEVVNDLQETLQQLENKRILVVGGKGFLGTYFVRILVHINKISFYSYSIIKLKFTMF